MSESYLDRPWGMGSLESKALCDRGGDGYPLHRVYPIDGPQFIQEDLQHIVAVHNACLGINPEAVPEMLEICRQLSDVKDALDGGKELIANQGQALDGISALANFRSIATKAQEVYKAQPPATPEPQEPEQESTQ